MIAASLLVVMATGANAQNVVTKAIEKVTDGIASFYHNKFVGRKTATGEVFDQEKYTAASNIHKLGTYVKVTNARNGEVVYVKVNDRMAASNKRLLDLTAKAAADLKFRKSGTTNVTVEPVSESEGRQAIANQLSTQSVSANQL